MTLLLLVLLRHCSVGLAVEVCPSTPPGTPVPVPAPDEGMTHPSDVCLAPGPAAGTPGEERVHGARCTALAAPAAGQRLSPAHHALKSTLADIHPWEMWHSLPWEWMGRRRNSGAQETIKIQHGDEQTSRHWSESYYSSRSPAGASRQVSIDSGGGKFVCSHLSAGDMAMSLEHSG